MLNDKSSTYINFSSGTKEVLDIVLCSSDAFTSFTKFEVLSKYDMNSDHLPIKVDFNFKKNKIERSNLNRANEFDFEKANWKKYKQHLPIHFPSELNNDIHT
jgi:hypothetical protein